MKLKKQTGHILPHLNKANVKHMWFAMCEKIYSYYCAAIGKMLLFLFRLGVSLTHPHV